MSRKYFFGFRSPQLLLDIRLFLTQGFSLEIRSRKAGPPFATRSRKRELCFQSYASIITRTDNFLSQKFSNFFWKLLQFMFQATLIIMSRKYFFGFQSPDSSLEGSPLNFRQCPLMTQKHVRCLIESKKGQDIGGHWRTNIMRIFRIRFWTQGFLFVMRSRKAGLPLATRVRLSPPMSV